MLSLYLKIHSALQLILDPFALSNTAFQKLSNEMKLQHYTDGLNLNVSLLPLRNVQKKKNSNMKSSCKSKSK